MNPIDEPLDEQVLDELLSADLDGELAAAAADLGVSVEDAREAVSTPAAAARRAALARARAVIGAPVPLDADTAARLVTESITRGGPDDELAAARHRKRRADTARRVLVAAGSAAAVIAVIVGLSNLSLSSSNDSQGTAARAPTESADTRPGTRTTGPVELGDVSDAEQLRRRVTAQLNPPPDAKGLEGGTASTFAEASGPLPQEGYANDNAAQTLKQACAPAARATAGGSAPVLTASAVSDGRPVVVYAFRRGAAYDVVVVDRACSVVSRLSLP
jgi:hypothetical protein